jgi:FkbH-like protein
MYETEANLKTESAAQVPPKIRAAFGELKGKLVSRTLISWGEHCTECGWPTCYSTCDMYSPREDLKCRRFVDGMVRVDCAESMNGYLIKIAFKRWGMLWARGNFRFHSARSAERLEARDYRIGKAIQHLPGPNQLRRSAVGKRYALKKRLASRGASTGESPTSFTLECYNPQPQAVKLSLRIRSLHSQHPLPNLLQLLPGFRTMRELTEAMIPFESLLVAAPGFNRVIIPFAQMAPLIDLRAPFRIDITPNDVEDGTTLYFGIMDFVRQVDVKTKGENKIKCVVWDLDNTLWDGTLVEDGLTKLRLRPEIRRVIHELDRRGILQSVASKNNPDEAMEAIKSFQLDSYFLHPQISWDPKSGGVKAIATALNIGMDSLLFVDDSEFELQEVAAACQGVRILNAANATKLLEREECRVPVTAESVARRQMYQVEAARGAMARTFGGDYLAFLRDCHLKLEIDRLTEDNLERVHELTQRTNQMNFSGNRYTRELLREVLAAPDLDTYVLHCCDRFGSYGIIGFSIVDRREPRMTDLMFSCRVQSKRVEHAFLAYLIRRYIAASGRDFFADYKRTSRNAPSGKVFGDLGMRAIQEVGGVSVLVFPKHQSLPDDEVVEIKARTGEFSSKPVDNCGEPLSSEARD